MQSKGPPSPARPLGLGCLSRLGAPMSASATSAWRGVQLAARARASRSSYLLRARGRAPGPQAYFCTPAEEACHRRTLSLGGGATRASLGGSGVGRRGSGIAGTTPTTGCVTRRGPARRLRRIMFEFELRSVTRSICSSCEAGQVIQDSGKLSPVRADPQNAKAHAVTSLQRRARRLIESCCEETAGSLTLSWALPA